MNRSPKATNVGEFLCSMYNCNTVRDFCRDKACIILRIEYPNGSWWEH